MTNDRASRLARTKPLVGEERVIPPPRPEWIFIPVRSEWCLPCPGSCAAACLMYSVVDGGGGGKYAGPKLSRLVRLLSWHGHFEQVPWSGLRVRQASKLMLLQLTAVCSIITVCQSSV